MRILAQSVAATLFSGALFVIACSSDPEAGSSSGTSGASGNGTSGTSGTGEGGTSGTSGTGGTSGTTGTDDDGGTSGTVTPPTGPDDILIPFDSIWRTTTEWYRPIDTAPKADISEEMIGALKMWGTTGFFQIDFSFNLLDGTGGKATTLPQPPEDEDDGSESDHVKVPIPAKGYVEGDFDLKTDDCTAGEDCHMLILSPGTKELFETYHTHTAGGLSGALSLWKLDKVYPRSNRGLGCSSADAAGMPITPGLIGYKETKAGKINHALRFIIRNDYVRTGDNAIFPASHGTTAGESPNGVPYGARFRLKAGVDESIAKSPGAKALIKALKKYGMIMADGGNIPLVAESAKVHQDKDPKATWEGLLAPRDLGSLKPTDFEVIAVPKADPSKGDKGWFKTKAEYINQLTRPLDCEGIVQP